MKTAKYYIENLQLQKHPEGGWFKEVYRSDESVSKENLPERFDGNRNYSTSIYFLLEKGDFSAFHKIKSDELWHFHDGEMLEIYMISPDGELTIKKLGLNIENGENPQLVIPHSYYFAASPKGKFTLCACTVSPGFDFNDFEMPATDDLIKLFPQHSEIINSFA